MTVTARKSALRGRAAEARDTAHGRADPAPATRHLLDEIARHDGVRTVSAYVAMRSEIDPLPALEALHRQGVRLCLPVVEGRARPLRFLAWTPGDPLVPGGFGTRVPAGGAPVAPDLLIVPMLAFDRRLYRLGYGGGFYDRTLAALRQSRPAPAIGLAYEAQRMESVPTEPTDIPLDAVATEAALHRPA